MSLYMIRLLSVTFLVVVISLSCFSCFNLPVNNHHSFDDFQCFSVFQSNNILYLNNFYLIGSILLSVFLLRFILLVKIQKSIIDNFLLKVKSELRWIILLYHGPPYSYVYFVNL